MSTHFVQSAILRESAIGLYRLYAQAQFWRSGCRVFVNSIPKSGTHLLTQDLSFHPSLQNSALFVRVRDVNKLTQRREHLREFELDENSFIRHLYKVRSGQFFIGHLPYSDKLKEILDSNDVRIIQVIRHPLDIIVSQFFYMKGLKRHHRHRYFTTELLSDAERLNVLIDGNNSEPPIDSLGERLRKFEGWLNAPSVLVVRFEDLVGAKGGGCDAVRKATLHRIMKHVGVEPSALRHVDRGKVRRTATLRQGMINAWSDTLTEADIVKIKKQFGEIIARFGYEIPN